MILSGSSSSACVSAVSELMLWLMWFPPVTMSLVVLLVALHVRIEYPVALLPLYLEPPSDWPKMWMFGSVGGGVIVWWNTSASWSMTMLHILSADLLYSLYLQLMYGVAFVGVFQPWLCQPSSLSMILLIAGMSLGLDSVESPLTMSASVWLSTMIFMQCVFSSCGLHSSSVPSVLCLLLFSSSVGLCFVVLV